MTPKQKKAVLISIIVIFASYVVRNVVIGAMQMANYQRQLNARRQQQRQRQQQKQTEKPKPKEAPVVKAPAPKKVAPVRVAPPPRPVPPPPSPFAKLAGVWRGRAAIDGRGICDVKLELRDAGQEDRFSGFSSMTCNGAMPGRKVTPRERMLNTMDPEGAIFSGGVEKGSIELKANKTVGTDSNGCAPTSFSLTPFGTGQLAAEWQEGACTGGKAVLKRAGR